ncbi:bifunctional diaminohydroxyphosphoribosylaminopyrimidine deaminase/5-amino-6-(5-phosphoribosylamino)uracil reductase RibD [Gillisia limnaea]|uniref:Riboflavin biosynthesis protein RibD n=1 Tax=Gillisia limnaea (strain DSM 15749 / LMG 21470 / R-8282) TaxID=865937 RepID=H2BWJ7_GILLR|nr:bifunctional diaminohydroxyphosphoribosylaminopyrimidine deaminase/5-amino-6-(5-phosphoribosylamino)uracil reductase RibD [Gillisia limnaea]EHQ01940.1 diaminohydroxyphosphoribosylaminopyrimidine deaminase [Gillisia limnaea DSM 15749]
MKIHEKYINRCIQLAQNGLGTTYPNPLVGSVLTYKNSIIGEGWHQKAGGPHAEVNAIRAVKDQSLLKKATIYVSLEPCSHYGKTPPCSDLIIASGIKKVVIGIVDPFAKVKGKGIKKLLDAGCEVSVGILEDQCRELNKRFFTFHEKKRPYIILKWASTKNNFIAPLSKKERAPVWITNKYSRQLVHKWRSEEQAILVGTNTAVADNPKLNTRLWEGSNPVRILLDQNLRTPKDSALFDRSIKTIVITSQASRDSFTKNEIGKNELILEAIDFNKEIAPQIVEVLYTHELQSVIIEGGGKTLQTFIDSGLWDEARIFTGEAMFPEGVKAPEFNGKLAGEHNLLSDKLKIYIND